MTLEFVDPTDWWLKIPPPLQVASVSSEHGSTPDRCWNAYLNQVCLNVVLPWIQSEYAPEADSWLHSEAQAAMWEIVNGTAIVFGSTRLVLLPSEVIDDAELEVPQEWVDIPGWIADYYLAVQVRLEPWDDPWIRVWGYATHQDLKMQGEYDPDDRTYCLSREFLNRDLSTFGVMLHYCSQAQTRTAIDPLPQVSAVQAKNLIQRLGNPSVTFPRLMVPFPLWGALLERQTWRQQLYQQRTQPLTSSTTDAIVQLSQWFQNRFTTGWQSIQSLLGAEAETWALSLRSGVDASEIAQVKPIDLIAPSSSASVILLVKLSAEDDRVGVVAQIHPASDQSCVPSELVLSLHSETGEVLQSVQAGEQDNYIQLRRFKCPVGTRFSLQILWGAASVTEDFVI